MVHINFSNVTQTDYLKNFSFRQVWSKLMLKDVRPFACFVSDTVDQPSGPY